MPQLNISVPDGLRDAVKDMARRNRRSMAQEIVFRLEQALLVDEARLLFGNKAAGELAAQAATGEGLGNQAPAAARDTGALQGADINPR
jgi:hypothetical protein